MLKFGKDQKNISVIVGHRERFFTSDLTWALIYALAFHLGFLVIFHIKPFQINWNQSVLPPVRVEADDFRQGTLQIDAQELPHIENSFHFRKFSEPTLPKHPQIYVIREEESMLMPLSASNPFEQLETDIYRSELTSSKPKSISPIELQVSGLLAHIPMRPLNLEQKWWQLPRQASGSGKPSVKAVYDVLVEGQSGKIFWFESQESTHIALLDNMAEELIRELYFQPTNHTFVTGGTVEFRFNLENL